MDSHFEISAWSSSRDGPANGFALPGGGAGGRLGRSRCGCRLVGPLGDLRGDMRLHAGLDKGTLREERLPFCLSHGAIGDRRIDPGSFAERPLDVSAAVGMSANLATQLRAVTMPAIANTR
jgi:hypothetical protein